MNLTTIYRGMPNFFATHEGKVRNRTCHFVTFAEGGLSMYSVVAQHFFGITQNEQDQYLNAINSKCETGTIWPRAALTAIPRTFCRDDERTYWDVDKDGVREFDSDALDECLRDALRANTEHARLPEIYFHFSCDVSNPGAIESSLRKVMEEREFRDVNTEVFLEIG